MVNFEYSASSGQALARNPCKMSYSKIHSVALRPFHQDQGIEKIVNIEIYKPYRDTKPLVKLEDSLVAFS